MKALKLDNEIATLKLTNFGVFDITVILRDYISSKTEDIKQAEFDVEHSQNEPFPFDNFVDYLAALHSQKQKAENLLKSLEKQANTQY